MKKGNKVMVYSSFHEKRVEGTIISKDVTGAFQVDIGDYILLKHQEDLILLKEGDQMEKTKQDFYINGSIEVDVDEETFNTEFLEFLTSKGWEFAGVIKPVEDEDNDEE